MDDAVSTIAVVENGRMTDSLQPFNLLHGRAEHAEMPLEDVERSNAVKFFKMIPSLYPVLSRLFLYFTVSPGKNIASNR